MQTAAAPNRTTAAWRRGATTVWTARPSKVLPQIHAGVQLPDLGFVAVEHQRLAPLCEQAALADAPLGRLAPARLIDVRVDVGIEPVLTGRRLVPGSHRLHV